MERCLEEKICVWSKLSLLPLLHCPHIIAIILPPNSVRASSFESVVGEKNRHRGGGGSKTSCFSCPAANCTTPTHHFHIFPHISTYCQLHAYTPFPHISCLASLEGNTQFQASHDTSPTYPTYFLTAKKPAVHLTVIGIKRDSESVHTRTEGEMAHIVPSSSHQSAYTSPKPVIHIQYPSTS